jgi:FtsH-binding integral membrane protein
MRGGKPLHYHFNGTKLITLMINKKEFLILIFANLIAQLGITYYVMQKTNNSTVGLWPLFAAQIIIIFILALVPMPPIIKFLVFCAFSYTFGLSMSHLKDKYEPQMVEIAIQGALSIFGVMLTLGIVIGGFGIHLGYKYGIFLLVSLLALIIARLVLVLGQGLSTSKKALAYIGLGLFSLFIIYDTSQILSRDYYGDFITASLDYYLDILNLFSNMLSINDN